MVSGTPGRTNLDTDIFFRWGGGNVSRRRRGHVSLSSEEKIPPEKEDAEKGREKRVPFSD